MSTETTQEELGPAAAALVLARELGPAELEALAEPLHKRARELADKIAARRELGSHSDRYWRTVSHANRWNSQLWAAQRAAAALEPHAARWCAANARQENLGGTHGPTGQWRAAARALELLQGVEALVQELRRR